MKIKIISDGTCMGTRILNTETNKQLDGVVKVEWSLDAREARKGDGDLGKCILTLNKIPIEIIDNHIVTYEMRTEDENSSS